MSQQALPSPPLDDALAAPFRRLDTAVLGRVAADGWDLDVASVRRLDTERDDTVVVTHAGGRHVLKVAHPLDDPVVLDLQCAALQHAARRDPDLPLPHVTPDCDGAPLRRVTGADGEPRLARLLSHLDGEVLDYGATTPAQRSAVGAAAGRLSLALADLEHPGADRVLAWDLRQVGTLRPLLGHVADPGTALLVEAELDTYDDGLGEALHAVRRQVVHHDVNPDNVLVDRSSPEYVSGILDFGDVVRSSVVGDLAVAMSYAVATGTAADADDPWSAPYDVARGFRSVRDLTAEELELLPRLVRLRLAQRLLLNSWLASSDPGNAHYTGRSIARAGTALRRLTETPSPVDREGA
ncbi:MAG TPA: phosphotransferase [Candidatus Angelobacter sp.]|nr:phosphotransferase [Candidatus Angelobacter sp.]